MSDGEDGDMEVKDGEDGEVVIVGWEWCGEVGSEVKPCCSC